MARPPKQVTCDEAAKAELKEISKSPKGEYRMKLRAEIVLQCLEGKTFNEIMQTCQVSAATVNRWKTRFIEKGVKGLYDNHRSGRPAIYQKEFKKAVFEKLEQPPPDGYGQWDGTLLAKELGYSKHAVYRLLREHRISLARKRSRCVSTDPEFAAKAADVVGLYLTPNKKALVFCIDEKPNIQSLEFRKGYAVSSDHKLIQGLESTYKRRGTINLFAALEAATGRIHGKATDSSQKTKKGFLAFMEDLLRELPTAEEYHVVLDNHSIHKRHESWLQEHPNVFFHYTPTSASWLNMVEIWFGILTRKSLRGKSFENTEILSKHIMKFIETYNPTAKPFVWRKREIKGAQLTNNLRNSCK
jgi:transposase